MSVRWSWYFKAKLFYVTEPDEEQLAGILEFFCREYKEGCAAFNGRGSELMGGFVLKTGDVEYDYSLKGQLFGAALMM